MPRVNRINWTYVGNRASNSLIELRHFLESGNLVVFCNKKILLTDFDVFSAREYSFFIGEEFCRISIHEYENNMLGYDFKIIENVDTPLNRLRKKVMRKDLLKGCALVFAVALLLMSVIMGIGWLDHRRKVKDLQENGIVKTVRLNIRPHVHQDQFVNVTYKYWFRNRNYNRHIKLPMNKRGEYMTENGFPLETGDQFLFVFSSKNPANNKVDYNSPPPEQIYKYRCRVIDELNKYHPKPSEHVHDCLLDAVYRSKGISGWANLYYHATSDYMNAEHNRETYKKMMQQEALRKVLGNCKD